MEFNGYRVRIHEFDAVSREGFTKISGRSSRMRAISQLCFGVMWLYGDPKETFVDKSFYDQIQDMALQPNGTLTMCSWSYEHKSDCLSSFHHILTEEGVCFTFNLTQKQFHVACTVTKKISKMLPEADKCTLAFQLNAA